MAGTGHSSGTFVAGSAVSEILSDDRQRSEMLLAVLTLAGGMEPLLRRFRRNGLESAVDSWIAIGPNQTVSAEQVQCALPRDWLDMVGYMAETQAPQVALSLAQTLPCLVDVMTPNGAVPIVGLDLAWMALCGNPLPPD